MKTVYVLCEGQTEESFANEILYPYFIMRDIWIRPVVCTTSHTPSRKYTGGVGSYSKIRRELTLLCKGHKDSLVTTMFDYYGMPGDTPDIDDQNSDIFVRATQIEAAINHDVGMSNCCFHLMIHEFEGMLFSNPYSFRMIASDKIVNRIREIRDSFPTPEHINNSPQTAPSKRLEDLIPNYAKIRNGTLLAKDMGIDRILNQCPHFNKWVSDMSIW